MAAMSMPVERRESLRQPPGDTNTYVLGHMAGHDVVLVCLPQMGTTPAARVARQMRMAFPHLRFGLLAGIGGGIPSKAHDIRLGDVAAGTKGQKYGAVL
jgi:nucleoside phosphorylase